MRALYILRHSLTEANERRLYCGASDWPLSETGRALALRRREAMALPACELYVSSGLRRADETLALLAGREASVSLPDLQEMDFGAFEGLCYESLKADAAYLRWIEDETGEIACPGGESRDSFNARALRGGSALLAMKWHSALLICHGGVIVALMRAWFPQSPRGFYDWQPGPCAGYRIEFDGDMPTRFEEI